MTADYCLNLNGDLCIYAPWKLNDGLLWYDTTPDNRWTNNQSTVPYSTISITLPRARKFNSISLAIFDDTARNGVAACPEGIRVVNPRTNETVAFRNSWDDCVPNALNTITFAQPTTDTPEPINATTPDDSAYTIETDRLQIIISDKLYYTTAVSEIQIWVAPNAGPRYEAEDGVIGTFIGSYEGRALGLNGTIQDGGVSLGTGGWVELADVRTSDGAAGNTTLTVVGGGVGSVAVQINWLTSTTLVFNSGNGTLVNQTVEVQMLRGGNVVTINQVSGTPFVDAIVVGS